MKINIREVLIQEKITALAHEAQEAYEIIAKAFTNAFSLGQKEIPCFGADWKFDENFISLSISIDGVITYQHSFQDINIPISEEGFFTCFIAELEIQENNKIEVRNSKRNINDGSPKEELLNFGLKEDEKRFADAAQTLRELVQSCKRKLNEGCEKTKCISIS